MKVVASDVERVHLVRLDRNRKDKKLSNVDWESPTDGKAGYEPRGHAARTAPPTNGSSIFNGNVMTRFSASLFLPGGLPVGRCFYTPLLPCPPGSR